MDVTQTAKGIVYIIRCTLDGSFCYIGSTFDRVDKRFNRHKGHYNDWLNGKGGEVSIFPYFKKYGIENFYIKSIRKKPYIVIREHNKDTKHLRVYETLWIRKMKNQCVNKLLPFNPLKKIDKKNSSKKYREENPEKNKENSKKYREENPEKVRAKSKKYREEHPEKKKESSKKYRENNREKERAKGKKYREEHPEKKKETCKKYYENNKEKYKEKIACANCGSIVRKDGLTQHKKTFKCSLYKNTVPIYI